MDGLILTEEQLRKEVEYFLTQDKFVFDIESMDGSLPDTRGVPAHNQVVWLALATYGRAIVIPMGHPNGDVVLQRAHWKKIDGQRKNFPVIYNSPPEQLRPSVVFEILRPLFFSSLLKIAHNAVTDFVSIEKYYGEIPPGPVSDSIVCEWMTDENIQDKKGSAGGPKRPIKLGLKELTKFHYGQDYDKEHVGKCIELHPFSKVAAYALLDVQYTWFVWHRADRILREEGLGAHRALEERLTEVLFHMNLEGAPVDVQAILELEKELTAELEVIEAKVYKAAGKIFNINSPAEKQVVLFGSVEEGNQGLTSTRLTLGGMKKSRAKEPITFKDLSTDKEALERLVGNPVVDALLEYSEVGTLLKTYVKGYLGDPDDPGKPTRIFNGRVHASLSQYGTVTSRFSCVSGDTLLTTNRGTFTMYEYAPMVGDTVTTHTGAQKQVLRKIYKGIDQVYAVTLSNGARLKCTETHRVLTPTGWSHIKYLEEGSEVLSYGGIKEFYREYGECTGYPGSVSGGGQAHSGRTCKAYGNNIRKRSVHYFLTPEGSSEGRESLEVFPVEAGGEESYDRKEGEGASQLHRGCVGCEGVSYEEGRKQEILCPQDSDGGSHRYTRGRAARGLAGTPCGSESLEQLFGQPSSGDPSSPLRDSFTNDRASIVSIVPLGEAPVWDIEVEGDHSYATHGSLNHNCNTPNLQNIPRPGTPKGKKVRGLFRAPEGYKLVVADYAQIEYRVLAHFIGHGVLYEGFHAGLDAHKATASSMYNIPIEDVTADMRQYSKSLGFGVLFGSGVKKLAAMLECPLERAQEIMDEYSKSQPEVIGFKQHVVDVARARKIPGITTITGFRRRVWNLNYRDSDRRKEWNTRSSAERKVFNSLVQGSAAGLIKMAMVRVYDMLKEDWKKNPSAADKISLILSVHDELVLLAPDHRAEEAMAMLEEAMAGEEMQKMLKVPLVADAKIVQRWSAAK